MVLSAPDPNQNTPSATSPQWSEFLNHFKQSTDPFQFQVWGDRLTLMNENSDHVRASVPRSFQKEWLQEKHGQALEEAIEHAYGPETQLLLEVESEEDTSSLEEPPSGSDPADTSTNRSFPFARQTDFDPKYTFEEFVVGSSNELAYSAARAVAEEPATRYNPLFIYGGVGLGKTHLLQAIGHRVKQRWEQANVKYMTAEDFTNKIIQAIREGHTKDFKYRYRNIDLFLVDDIQFFANKDAAQEEFFHTFNELYENGKHTVFCSDRPPQEIPRIEDRLRNRFEMGLITDIQAPEYETRLAVLQKKTEREELHLPADVLEFIAENVTSNVRALEGSLNRLASLSSLTGRTPSIDMAKEHLEPYMSSPTPDSPPSIESILERVAEYFDLQVQQLRSSKRTKSIARPRQVVMYLARKLTNHSYSDIGHELGGRDHSTVIHGVKTIANALEENESPLAEQVRHLKNELS